MQTLACTSPAYELLLGGQAGPGKSWVLLFMDIPDIKRFPDLRILFLRRETPDLGQLIQDAKEMYLPMGARYYVTHPDYKRSAFVFPRYTPEGRPIMGTQGAIAVFGHCQREDDKEKYSGFEFQRFRPDEVQQLTESQYLFFFSRIRTDNPEIRCDIRASCNPNGIGMMWLKRRFVDKLRPGEVRHFKRQGRVEEVETTPDDPMGLSRSWIPGDRKDNPTLMEGYEARLSALDVKQYNALALGLWEMPRMSDQLVDPDWWDRAVAGKDLAPEPAGRPKKALGADFASRGTDSSAFAFGVGRKLTGFEDFMTPHSQEFAWRYFKRVEELGGATNVLCAMDSNGPGTGAADLLETGGVWIDGGNERRFGAIPGIERCTHKDRRFELQFRGAIKFPNFRSQMYWKLREDLRNGRLDLTWLKDPDNMWGGYERLAEEVLAHTFRVPNGQLEVVSKDQMRMPGRLGRSPDLCDALAIWNWIREFAPMDATKDEWDAWESIDGYMKGFRKEMSPDTAKTDPCIA